MCFIRIIWRGYGGEVAEFWRKSLVYLQGGLPLPTVPEFKAMIAKTKIYRESQKLLRPMFQAFQANVTAYTVSLLSEKLGNRIDLDLIWAKQAISPELLSQITVWANEVNDALHASAGGRMVSEWAKRPECKEAVMGASYSPSSSNIPEIKV